MIQETFQQIFLETIQEEFMEMRVPTLELPLGFEQEKEIKDLYYMIIGKPGEDTTPMP